MEKIERREERTDDAGGKSDLVLEQYQDNAGEKGADLALDVNVNLMNEEEKEIVNRILDILNRREIEMEIKKKSRINRFYPKS